jgi:hypothetical protein
MHTTFLGLQAYEQSMIESDFYDVGNFGDVRLKKAVQLLWSEWYRSKQFV